MNSQAHRRSAPPKSTDSLPSTNARTCPSVTTRSVCLDHDPSSDDPDLRPLRLISRLESAPPPGRMSRSTSLYSAFRAFLEPAGGEALFAPLRLRIRYGKFREPDLLLVRDARDARSGDRFWTGADAVVEVVSPDEDLVHKRRDYAEAAVPEYWIVDPGTETITVLELGEDGYVEQGVYGRGERGRVAVPSGIRRGRRPSVRCGRRGVTHGWSLFPWLDAGSSMRGTVAGRRR